MDIGALRRGRDHEKQVGRLSVQSLTVHALRHSDGRDTRLFYRTVFGVRNTNSVCNGGRSLGFSFQNPLFKLCLVSDISHLAVEGNEQIKHLFFCGDICV